MALPNYSPSGIISFGCVPWDGSYSHVRLYTSLSEQQSDIASLMTTKAGSDDYVYIGRNRRLKVNLPADSLYHCNYCMYQNASVGTGWIYCFVSDVQYVNDHTSEVTLDTDVFQTYLYGTDWTIPACFIERETTPNEDERYMLTSEPDFPLVYTVENVSGLNFDVGGLVIQTASKPEKNQDLIDSILNPTGYYSEPVYPSMYKGIIEGATLHWCRIHPDDPDLGPAADFLEGLNYAGAIESVVSVFMVPDFVADSHGFRDGNMTVSNAYEAQDEMTHVDKTFEAPSRGTDMDGYTPRNKKLLYYPYNFLKLTDYNGSESELRFELMGDDMTIDVKAPISPTCQAFVYPHYYMSTRGYSVGIVVACGAQGSWCNNQFQNWLAQNSGSIAITVAGVAMAGVTGGTSMAAAAGTLALTSQMGNAKHLDPNAAKGATKQMASGKASLLGAGVMAANQLAQVWNASKQPQLTRGETAIDVRFSSGMQGVWCQHIVTKAEVAQVIDQFFDRWGYEVDRIEAVNITSRPSWNYVKTQGAAPRSANVGSSANAPVSRGRGTPAEALDVIRRAFDAGVTFWHTTSGFGDFSLANGV